MATQKEIDSLTAQLEQLHHELTTAQTTIESEYAQLEQQIAGVAGGSQPASSVDLTGLRNAIGELAPQAEALATLKANPPAVATTTSASDTAAAAAASPGGPMGQSAIDQAAAQH